MADFRHPASTARCVTQAALFAALVSSCGTAEPSTDPLPTGDADRTGELGPGDTDAAAGDAAGPGDDAALGNPDGGDPVPAGTLSVQLAQGWVVGQGDDAVQSFRGIPYAQPPQRWRPPQPPLPGSSIVNGEQTIGVKCLQNRAPPVQSGTVEVDLIGQEDCLYLDVYKPATVTEPLPIMVWLHPGGLVVGSNAIDGSALAYYGDVVVVTINYRLDIFGFLTHPDLTAESGDSGNYGFLDQIRALEWVQNNIAAFGGDPNNVTLFGVSAGAHSACTLVISPRAAGLFHRAAVQSWQCVTKELGASEQVGLAIAQHADCSDVDCLRAATPEALVGAVHTYAQAPLAVTTEYVPHLWVAKHGGTLLPGTVRQLVEGGLHNDVPILMGTTADEGYSRANGFGVYTLETFDAMLADIGLGPGEIEALYAHYATTYDPALGYPDDYAYSRLIGDLMMICPQGQLLRLLATNQTSPVYRYLFDHHREGRTWAKHGEEISYLFGSFPGYDPSSEYLPLDQAVMEQMVYYWTDFARTGDPNAATARGLSAWPAFTAADPSHLVIQPQAEIGVDLRGPECALLGEGFY